MIGQTISHYRILCEIGRGGMGDVFLAEDLKLGRQVAVKFLASNRQTDPEAEERFISEAKTASALDHRGISVIHEIDRTAAGHLFMVMTYYPGGSIKDRLTSGPMSAGGAIAMMLEIAAALQAAHASGLVHRDLKPANVMLAADGSPKIIDFGLAKLSSQITLTRTGSSLGTVAYMSPEQIHGHEVDQRADFFSLGIMLFEMLTRKLPFCSNNETSAILGIINDEPARLAQHLDEIPPGLQHVLDRALAKHPDDRYQSTEQFIADLQRVQAGQAAGLGLTTRLATRGRRWRRRLSTGRTGRFTAGLALFATMILVGFLAVQVFSGRQQLVGTDGPANGPLARSILVKPDGSGDVPTISAAMRVAASGDTILLADGIFFGPGNKDINFPTISLTIMSRSNDPSLCVIDCQGHPEQEAVGFRLNFLADFQVSIQGITIANSWTKARGGALRITKSSATVTNCVFVNNEAAAGGGGTGGAVLVTRDSRVDFTDCVFKDNRAGDAGGGLNFASSGGTILRCEFRGNWAKHGGSGIYVGMSEVEIRDCIFTGNSCGPGHWGSSLHFSRMESRGLVIGCTFTGDNAPDEVIFARRGAAPTLRNCLIAFNGPGRAVDFDGTAVTIEGCNIFGNEGGDWVGQIEGWDKSGDNFSADPLFCNLPGKAFSLGQGSSCLPLNNSTGRLVGAVGQGCGGRSLLNVPDDFTTIVAALGSAEIGDTVQVGIGTWAEHDLRLPAGVTLRGVTGNPAEVVIDAKRQGRVILCDSLSTGARLEGLTLTGGLAAGSYPADRGGGIACFSTSIEVNNCLITGNQAYDGGGFFSEYGASIHFRECTITDNLAEYWGGGLSSRNCPDLVFEDCDITDNQCQNFGGGFSLKNSMTRLERCTITNNLARQGSGVMSQQSTTKTISCLFTGNQNRYSLPGRPNSVGGTLEFNGDSGSLVNACTLVDNLTGPSFGALTTFMCDLLVTNTIVCGTIGGSSIRTQSGGNLSLACSNLYANQGGDFIQRQEGLSGKNGNLNANPLFVDQAAGDYRLQSDSPCYSPDKFGCGLIGALPVWQQHFEQEMGRVYDAD